MKPIVSDGAWSPAEGVCAFLASLGVSRTSSIHLVGRGALASLLWLCRHGFDQVAILNGAPAPAERADLLLCLDASGAATFERLAAGMRRVRPGGTIVLRAEGQSCTDRERARRLLRRPGFHIERRLRSGRGDVYIARRDQAPAAIAAAGR